MYMGNAKQVFVKGESSAKSEEGNFKTESLSPKISGPMGCASEHSANATGVDGQSPAPAGKERADKQELKTASKVAVGTVVASSILLCGPVAIVGASIAAVAELLKFAGVDTEGDEPPEELSREEIKERKSRYHGPDMSD